MNAKALAPDLCLLADPEALTIRRRVSQAYAYDPTMGVAAPPVALEVALPDGTWTGLQFILSGTQRLTHKELPIGAKVRNRGGPGGANIGLIIWYDADHYDTHPSQ